MIVRETDRECDVEPNLRPNDQLPVWETVGIRDSIAAVSHTLAFQVGPIRVLVPGIAGCSLEIRFAVAEYRMAIPNYVSFLLLRFSVRLECRFVLFHVPSQTPYHDGL
jgi:hypothetical protein